MAVTFLLYSEEVDTNMQLESHIHGHHPIITIVNNAFRARRPARARGKTEDILDQNSKNLVIDVEIVLTAAHSCADSSKQRHIRSDF